VLKFFGHPNARCYLRGLADEFGDSTNAVRVELMKLEEAGLLKSAANGQRVIYEVNTSNLFYTELVSIVSKFLGFHDLVEMALAKIGNLKGAYVVGDYARGVDSGTISIVIIGCVNEGVLHGLVDDVSKKINRKIDVSILPVFDAEIRSDYIRLL
jgi:hypothetical protein